MLGKILKKEGDMVAVGEVIGYLESSPKPRRRGRFSGLKRSVTQEKDRRSNASHQRPPPSQSPPQNNRSRPQDARRPRHPAARRALREHGLTAADVEATGPSLRRKDVLRYVDEQKTAKPAREASRTPARDRKTRTAGRSTPTANSKKSCR